MYVIRFLFLVLIIERLINEKISVRIRLQRASITKNRKGFVPGVSVVAGIFHEAKGL